MDMVLQHIRQKFRHYGILIMLLESKDVVYKNISLYTHNFRQQSVIFLGRVGILVLSYYMKPQVRVCQWSQEYKDTPVAVIRPLHGNIFPMTFYRTA